MHSTIKYLAYSLVLTFVLASCSDSNIGVAVRPGDDFFTVKTAVFPLDTKTIEAGSLYSETDKVVLGEYHDNIYGSFKVDFLSEFRYIRDLSFKASTVGDSLDIVLYYRSFFGDSTAVHEVTVYRLDKQPLDFSTNYKSDIDVNEFCSFNEVLGVQRYVAYDKTVGDSLTVSGYCNKVRVRMPQYLMQKMIDSTYIYQSQDAFVKFLKGVYVTNTYGSQTVLEIDSVNLEMAYHYADTLTSVISGRKDSVVWYSATALFPANRETTEVIHVKSQPVDISTIPDSIEYISAPGGTFVEVNVPFMTMYDSLVRRYQVPGEDFLINFNYFSLILECAEMADASIRTTAPLYLIFIRKADVERFFVQSLYPVDGINTSLGLYNYYTDSNRFIFSNAGETFEEIMHNAMNMSSDAERKAYFDSLNPYQIIPVTGTTDIAGTNATIRHLFDTYGIRVRSGSNATSPMRIVVTYTNL